jgi:hypothetical protein
VPSSRSFLTLLVVSLLAAALLLPTGASSHPERTTSFPYPATGHVPTFRKTGPRVVVCKGNSKKLLKREFRHRPKILRGRLALLKKCRFRDIQAGINRAGSNYRVMIMPGLYREKPSRAVPFGGPGQEPCINDYITVEGDARFLPPPAGPRSNDPPERANRNYAIKCPNSKNLIAVIGDTRPEPTPQTPTLPQCNQLCNLQIQGMGAKPTDVVIQADRVKLDGLRIDRASGVYLTNFTVEQAAFNDIDLIEVDGFKIDKVVARYGQNYGILSFTATHGLYDHVTAYGNGDSGVYPGSTMKGCDVNPNQYGTCEQTGCQQPSIEIRNTNSYGNTLGYSGTAGNSTYLHDNKFHDNASGLATDSFAAGHPGMPQECFHWTHNEIYSNNVNVFAKDRQDYCMATPFVKRDKTIVCPQFQTPVGTGVVMGGANRDTLDNNFIYDNWRQGVLLLTVPASLRGDHDPAHQQDTSNENHFVNNVMGRKPDGSSAPNGLEFKWDGGGRGNCFEGNTLASGKGSDPAALPDCNSASPVWVPPNPAVTAPQVPCTAWDPYQDPEPVGCDWFTTPPKP